MTAFQLQKEKKVDLERIQRCHLHIDVASYSSRHDVSYPWVARRYNLPGLVATLVAKGYQLQ